MLFLRHRYFLFSLILWGGFTALVFSHSIAITSEGLFAGHEYIWSDWAQHIALVRIFATKSPSLWFAYHPTFADGKLTYAFLTNLISALFIRAGFSLESAMILPSILFSLVFIAAAHKLFAKLLRSERQAFLALLLFFCSAGFGIFTHLASGKDLFEFKSTLSTLQSYSWDADNFFIGMLLPQRAFLLGIALATTALLFLWEAFEEGKPKAPRLATAAIAMGLLPVAHMHSLIALSFILLPISLAWLKREPKAAFLFALSAICIAAALYFHFIADGIQTKGFMRFNLGLAATGFLDWLWFWGRALGAVLFLAVVGIRFTSQKIFFSGFFLLFIAANLIQFQPTLWDNSKLILWAYFGFAALAAQMIGSLAKGEKWQRVAALVLFLTSSLTGMIELAQLTQWQKHEFRMLSTAEMQFAEDVRIATDPLARFATAPTHDHPISVWGARPVLLGYEGWAMNFGFNYQGTKADLEAIYSAKDGFKELLKKHNVSYLYVGPAERRTFKVDEMALRAAFPAEFSSTQAQAYVLRTY